MTMAKKNKISVGLIRGNNISTEAKPDVELFNELVKIGKEAEEIVDPVLLISRVDYPITVKYGDRMIRVSPRSQLKVADGSLLGELPNGIYKKKLSN
jgi:hypothetical protein